MAFFCINCKSGIDAKFKACPFCGEPITDFLRRYMETPIDGKYQILSRLGVGGMGEVYKVLHTHLNSVRVIKLMRAAIAGEESSHERFVREARLATRIHHPNVATLFDFSTLEDNAYHMVWEYIEGTNLMEAIRARGCLSPKYAAKLAYQALMGLDAIHRVGIVHRDISPENLMILNEEDGQERVKIIDLGIAKQWGEGADDKTKTGMFVGKWKYCSPEHLGMLKEGENIDGRADLYSFGIVMYEMLTGTPPFVADTPHRYLLLHATEIPRPLALANPAMKPSPELEAVIFKSLEKDRNKRFATAREFAKALEALIPQLDDTAAVPAAREYHDEPTQERAIASSAPTILTSAARSSQLAPTVAHADLKEMTPTVASQVNVQTVMNAPLVGRAPKGSTEETELPTLTEAKRLEEVGGRSGKRWLGAVAAVVVVAVIGVGIFQRYGNSKGSSSPQQSDGSVAAAPLQPLPQGHVAFNAFPWGEVIFIKNVENGKAVELNERLVTPTLPIDLPPGQYEVVLSNSNFPKPITQTIVLAAGENKTVMIQFESPSPTAYPNFGGSTR
ncbi:MAG TPA: serine/threonine-protein kinase [Thermoanaerobaculia bacterium]|nr:serine/threonine-protein kinase [Thermoanaerobaculia bacterium]